MPQRITKQTVRLLEVFLDDPRKEWFGTELMGAADLRSGTAYPILHRLEREGWLTSRLEGIDPSKEGRPRRRFYALTGVGQRAAQSVVAPRRGVSKTASLGVVPRAGGAPA
jgi:DNA-binding PadR family transcriptional regulator